MDLGAYVQIDNLGKLANDNGIEVPRLRGYRLMKDEKPVDFEELYEGIETDECKSLIEQGWCNSHCYTLSATTDRNKKRYLTYHYEKHTREDGTEFSWIVYDDVKWDKIHGKHRKALKLAIKQAKKAIDAQYRIWNKYCGRDDVLYIHARIGGNNWVYYEGNTKVATQPWFLEKVDDSSDCTYCDIYAKIEIKETKTDES